ncbi:MAG: hypothetical protein IBJ11_11515 [Phycisphaerales bacterium]|nr:hypothetical protein [Phycisphaerales bacterium]
MLKKKSIVLLSGVLVVAMAFTCLSAGRILSPVVRWWYQSFRGADQLHATVSRRDWLLSIRDCCERFQVSHGRLPGSAEELLLFDPACAQWIYYWPEWSIESYKKPNFSLFHSGSFVIVIDDPGLDWPGEPAINGRSPASWEKERYVLTSDNQVYLREVVIGCGGRQPDPKHRQ